MTETGLISRREAVALLDGLEEGTTSPGVEQVPLARAGGLTLAEAVHAPAAVPEVDRATMDGFAFDASEASPLTLAGEVGPEDDPPAIDPGEAVAVATGAPLPERADTVMMREYATVDDGTLSGPTQEAGTNVYPAGATAAAGERLFAAGERLAPRHAALLRDVGVDTVRAVRPLAVAVLATGTEIHEGRQPDRDSEMLANLVRRWGHRPTIEDPVPDDRATVHETIVDVAADHDLLLTTGGTSVGAADHLVSVLREHELLFRGIQLRPGRPVSAAVVAETPVCALPGKPVAAHTAATMVLGPWLTGRHRLPTVAADFSTHLTVPDAALEYAIPVTLEDERAVPVGHRDSSLSLYDEQFAPGRVSSSTRVMLADGVVLTRAAIEAGDRVQVVPYEVVE